MPRRGRCCPELPGEVGCHGRVLYHLRPALPHLCVLSILISRTVARCVQASRSRPRLRGAARLPMPALSLSSPHEAPATVPPVQESRHAGAYPARRVLALSLPASSTHAASARLRCPARAWPLSA